MFEKRVHQKAVQKELSCRQGEKRVSKTAKGVKHVTTKGEELREKVVKSSS